MNKHKYNQCLESPGVTSLKGYNIRMSQSTNKISIETKA